MHRRSEIDWAVSSMMPKAVPVAPFGLRAKQWYADADVETAAAIADPTNIATRKRLMIALPDLFVRKAPDYHEATPQQAVVSVSVDGNRRVLAHNSGISAIWGSYVAVS
jgi:hypothetical protein